MTIIKTIMTIMSLLVELHTGTDLSDARLLEMEKQILAQYEQAGITAFELENKLDMVNPGKLSDAINSSGEKPGQVTIFGISSKGNVIKYDLEFHSDGSLMVQTHSMTWRTAGFGTEPADSIGRFDESYAASDWSYTGNGYLFIQREFPRGWDGPSEQVGIKVLPVEDSLRKYAEKYVVPLGYENCDLLTTSWEAVRPEEDAFKDLETAYPEEDAFKDLETAYSEEDSFKDREAIRPEEDRLKDLETAHSEADRLKDLDIWKAYEKLFLMENGCTPDCRYGQKPNAITGDVHGEQEPVWIPDEDFESLIQKYFLLDQEDIRALAGYGDKGGYYYIPLSFDDVSGAYCSVPEVVDCISNPNGTLTLVIHEVDKQRADDQVTISRLTVLPDSGTGSGWKYISNYVVETDGNIGNEVNE